MLACLLAVHCKAGYSFGSIFVCVLGYQFLRNRDVMFWTAEITGTGDRSEFKLETVLESSIVVTEDYEAL